MAQKFVDDTLKENIVVVFSKTWCPYCKMAKDALNETGVSYKLIELDVKEREKDSNAILDYLLKKTGARSVPRVFVAEKFIGGGSEVKALGDQKKLVPLLQKNGAL